MKKCPGCGVTLPDHIEGWPCCEEDVAPSRLEEMAASFGSSQALPFLEFSPRIPSRYGGYYALMIAVHDSGTRAAGLDVAQRLIDEARRRLVTVEKNNLRGRVTVGGNDIALYEGGE